MKLDQFYTGRAAAEQCWKLCQRTLAKLPVDPVASRHFFIEPSAGSGAFYEILPEDRRIGVDLAPAGRGILQRDFLNWHYRPPAQKHSVIAVGNPPFGTRGKHAAQFINHAAKLADTIAFILPAIFRKFSAQRLVNPQLRLILSESLPLNSFVLPARQNGQEGRPYHINTVFQIWTRLPSRHKNLREFKPPKIHHPDFTALQYNNTREALRVFQLPFDFAIPCQGWQDYSRRETTAAACEKNKQWILLKPNHKTAHHILFHQINYTKLAQENGTTTPGFRKNDLVRTYEAIQ